MYVYRSSCTGFRVVFIYGFHRQVLWLDFAYGAPYAFDRLTFWYLGPENPLDGRRYPSPK
jgi:hypothetical protein